MMSNMEIGTVVALVLALSSGIATAQTPPNCNSVVKKVSLENTTGLTLKQQTKLSKLLLGRCFQREHPEVLSEAVYHQLRSWGYKPTVYDPIHGRDVRVLDSTLYPSPVAVTIDFRLSGLDDAKK